MRFALVAVFAIGCGFPHPSEKYTCSTTSECTGGRVCEQGFCVVGEPDASVDTAPTDAALCTMFSARHFDACAIVAPGGDLDLSQNGVYTYDTDTMMLTPPTGPATMPATQLLNVGRLISIQSLTVAANATLRVQGTHPLVIASWSTISVNGTIDASSDASGVGAGANPPACGAHAAGAGGNDSGGGGGGGGGGFRGAGGAGGGGSDGSGTPGAGGAAVAVPMLLGGCKGGTGGLGNQAGGAGGNGGGAVQLTAKDSITIAGFIHVGGAGGEPGLVVASSGDSGGGGGGSGGMIGLEAPSVTLVSSSTLAANGGGGGEGSDTATASTQRGADASASASLAVGGSGTVGGDGGFGSGGAVLGGSPGSMNPDGGGGGGGGAGYIAIKATTLASSAGVESPMHTLIP